jgi:hypothetical protein
MLIQAGFWVSANFSGSIFQKLDPGFGFASSLLVRSPIAVSSQVAFVACRNCGVALAP